MGNPVDNRNRRLAPKPQTPVPSVVQNPYGGEGATSGPLQLNSSSAPATRTDNPNNQRSRGPALPPLPPVMPGVGAFANSTNIRNPNNTPNGYNPTTAPYGYDMSGQGQREQFWNKNQGMWFDTPGTDWAQQQLPEFQSPWEGEQANTALLGTIAQPGAGQQYWNGISGSANTMTGAESAISGGYHGPNNAQSAFDTMQGRVPGDFQPQFDAYYDRMKQKTMGDVNAQSAARGSYGSNSALNGSIGASLDAEAQRAQASTDFMFKNSENQRNWMDSLSNAGRAADLSGTDAFQKNIDASKYGLDKTKTYGDLAFKAEDMQRDKNNDLSKLAFGLDESKLNRLQTGIQTGIATDQLKGNRLNDAYNASGGAQLSRENRINNLFNNEGNFEGDVMSFLQTNGTAFINDDGTVNEEALEAQIAAAADERGWSDQQREAIFRDAKELASILANKQQPTGGATG